jgi:hypothetical protein
VVLEVVAEAELVLVESADESLALLLPHDDDDDVR